MTETGRRSLLGPLKDRQPVPEIDPQLITRTAAAHGFDNGQGPGRGNGATPEPDLARVAEGGAAERTVAATTDDPPHGAPAPALVLRRNRKSKGRTQQLNVRLRPETISFINGRANDRGVDIADVIEELVANFSVA